MRKKRKAREGEFVCRCRAYKFPHRFGGGRCSGAQIVSDYWELYWGLGACERCGLLNLQDTVPHCEVVEGRESVTECPVWQEFVEFHEIKVREKLR